MARPIRDARLVSPTARQRLPARPEPYWRRISKGCYLGYRRGQADGSWVARWRAPAGNQVQHILGAADDGLAADGLNALSFDQAQAKAQEWFVTVAAQTMLGHGTGPYTVADCLRDYVAWLKDAKKSARHVETYAKAWILPALGRLDTAALTTERIETWRTEIRRAKPRQRTPRGRPPSYRPEDPDPLEADRKARRRANTYLVYLRAALNHAWRLGRITVSADIWMRVRPYGQVDRPRSNYLTEDQALLLVNACGPGLRELSQLALLTGARYGELCAFDVRDFDARNGLLYVRTSKSGRPRHIVLSEEGIALCRTLTAGRPLNAPLLRQGNGERWKRDLHRRPFKEAAARIGLDPSFTFHELRHTWASLAVMNGAELIVVAENLGHRDTRMVERVYGHLAHTYVARRIRETAPAYGFAADNTVVDLRRT